MSQLQYTRLKHMDRNNSIQLFEDRKIRTAWDEEQEEWYFSVQDVIAVLAESSDPKQYIKKMRARDPELSANWGYNLYPGSNACRRW